ncbi:MAG: hypothetical protein U9R07_07550 [Pseudomonadota bacterium]|nr:hypothetical protein [Pseudomonadota bacterium]
MSAAPPRKFSRTSATLAGALTGLALAMAGIAAVMVWFETSRADAVGPQAEVIIALLSGSFMLGLLFAFPTAAAMVFVLAALTPRLPWLDRAWAWALAGVLFTAPWALLFAMFDSGQFAAGPVWWFGLALGAVSGLAAWRARYPAVQSAPQGQP